MDSLPGLLLVLVAVIPSGLTAVYLTHHARHREEELLKLLRNAMNRAQSTQLETYLTLEREDKKAQKSAPELSREFVNDVISDRFTPADGLQMP